MPLGVKFYLMIITKHSDIKITNYITYTPKIQYEIIEMN